MSVQAPERPPFEAPFETSVELAARPVVEGIETAAPSPLVTSLAVFLSTSAAGWMVGGIFQGFLPRLVGVLGALIGTGAVALSFWSRRPSVVQYLGIAAAVAAGVLLVLPDAQGGSANLPSLVVEALRTGGLSSPPVPFDPGWRFILVVLMAMLGGGAASLSIALRQPKLGIFLPVPLVFAAALVQPPATAVYLTAIGIVLIPAALTVSHGVELARDGSTSGRFETRRLARSAGFLVAMMAALVVLGQLGLLAPSSQPSQIVPPQRPQQPPPQADRPLFTVESPRQLTWRLGVLDVYDGRGWLLPPYDPAGLLRFREQGGVRVPDQPDRPTPPASAKTLTALFTVSDIAGHTLPTVAGLTAVGGGGDDLRLEPRSETLRLPDMRVPRGFSYSVVATLPPGGAQLAAAAPPGPDMREFQEVPSAPPEVGLLLAKAPAPLYDRLQFVRNAYYKNVVAAGGGKPVDVPPSRVVEMLAGKEASPYEITAGEVLLARWAGVPARIGFGYYGGQKVAGNPKALEVRPRNGATWLEAHFEGQGWVPFVGIPPKAKGSLSENEKKKNPAVAASANLALATYIPVRVTTVRLFFEVARYWLVRAVPLVLAIALLLWLYPGALKALRGVRRRRWARARGPIGALLVSYAEFRDAAYDLNVGVISESPLEFLRAVTRDPEHEELAWLVTRALWGDLRRDVRAADAHVAEQMARHLTRRLRRAQTPTTRVLAVAARASLRNPYTDEVPNLWAPGLLRRLASAVGQPVCVLAAVPRRLRVGRATAPANSLMAVLMMLMLGSCASGTSAVRQVVALPATIAPDRIGALTFKTEPTLEAAYKKLPPNALIDKGHVLSIRQGEAVKGSLQIAPFKPDLTRSKKDIDELRSGVIAGLGNGKFELKRVGPVVLLSQSLPEQDLLLWFAPDTSYFELLVASKQFGNAPQVFAQVLLRQRGVPLTEAQVSADLAQEPDPRRGGVQ